MNQIHTKASSMKGKDQKSEMLSVAIGKRKEGSDLPEPWLQDVFFDSANPAGKQKKTSVRPKVNGEKGRNLIKIIIRKCEITKGGGRS